MKKYTIILFKIKNETFSIFNFHYYIVQFSGTFIASPCVDLINPIKKCRAIKGSNMAPMSVRDRPVNLFGTFAHCFVYTLVHSSWLLMVHR